MSLRPGKAPASCRMDVGSEGLVLETRLDEEVMKTVTLESWKEGVKFYWWAIKLALVSLVPLSTQGV